MNGLVYIGIGVNLIGVLVAAITLDMTAVVLAIGVPAVAVSIVGGWMVHQERQPIGAYLVMGSSLALLPIGAIGLVGGLQSARQHRAGATLGKGRQTETPRRQRPWTQAVVLFGIGSAVALFWVLGIFTSSRMDSINDPLALIGASSFAVLAAVEAVLLFNQHEQAFRLGTMLSVVALFACAIAGFYLHSYLAVGLIMLPIFALYLLYTGRTPD